MWKVLWTCIFRNKQLTSGRYVLKLKIKNIDDFRLDGCQAAATIESIIVDARHAVGDGDGCQAAAAIVFASRFISTICVLNGRKVMPRILKKPKKINI